jgi:hypothetical protein
VSMPAAERDKAVVDSEKMLRDLTCPAVPAG